MDKPSEKRRPVLPSKLGFSIMLNGQLLQAIGKTIYPTATA
jgi:hypothetical protein